MTSSYLRPLDFVSRFSAKRLLKRAKLNAAARRTAVRPVAAPGGRNGVSVRPTWFKEYIRELWFEWVPA
jgi:hypothetical protein